VRRAGSRRAAQPVTVDLWSRDARRSSLARWGWFEHPEERPWPRHSLTLYVGDGGDEDGSAELTGDVDDVPADHPRPACARERMTLVAVPTGDRP
jgi:hypothetical protein